ncbi:MAG: tRNA uridine-5-carboxymethylaminomethyl(34) synthesis GTPase MnmE [Clostridia bacterium]|nr:tRNA uridine-5-carboxymethylaminomethyl(34) synthesis GTPase MnmE [Clostridia bacterium]
MRLDDTIAAISTPAGKGGISIIRISGTDAVGIGDKVFKNQYGKTLRKAATHTITHGYAMADDGRIIDEVLCSVMLAPHTYTGEDVVEINCHGGSISTREILSRVIASGARLAEPGEFTKRAFLSGRMDLCEAESVIDIINAKTTKAHSLSVHQLKGALSQRISGIRERLLTLTAHLQVLIDFADEDLEPLSDEEYLGGLKQAVKDIDRLLATADRGKIIRDGIKTAIVGKPNVGKSSLLNLLYGEERAIVTDIEGTTRDTIEESVILGGVMLSIADTAGIRETSDTIEKIGVEKSKTVMEDADLVIFMADAKRGLDENDRFIMDSLKGKKTIALINKSEGESLVDRQELAAIADTVIDFSVKENRGMDELEAAVSQMFSIGDIGENDDTVITNVRHKDALIKAKSALESAVAEIETGIELNMTFIDIENAIAALGEITGQTVGEEIVDKIFHSFCVGK